MPAEIAFQKIDTGALLGLGARHRDHRKIVAQPQIALRHGFGETKIAVPAAVPEFGQAAIQPRRLGRRGDGAEIAIAADGERIALGKRRHALHDA
jgi:hypothetical protein